MKRRNWALIVLGVIGISAFILSRTVWGPPSRAAAASSHPAVERDEELSEAQQRYLHNQPRHWRQIVIKQK